MIEPVPDDVRPQSRMLVETDEWLVGIPLTWRAMAWWGASSEWCTVSDEAAFELYTRQGPLVVFHNRGGEGCWMLHPATGEFRDRWNKRAGWRGFVMRNPTVTGAILSALNGIATRQAFARHDEIVTDSIVYIDPVSRPGSFVLRDCPDGECVKTRMILKADGQVIASSYVENARYVTFAAGMDVTVVNDSLHSAEVALCNVFDAGDELMLSTQDTTNRARIISDALNFVGADWRLDCE